MRKRDLLLGLALCGLTSVFAQQPLFVYDFEQDGQDSLNGNGHLVYGTDTIWENIHSKQSIEWRNPEAQRDCTILIYKAVYSDFTADGAEKQDSWEIIPEEGNEDNHVFHLTTGDATGAADYQRVLRLYFPKDLIKDNTSYRVSYRVKANAEAQSELFVVRGIDYNDVRWQYWNGSKGDQTVSIGDFNPEVWTNASGVFFYLTDSLMEATAKERAGWWSGSWGDSEGIYQPNIHRMQAWFKTENSEYYVDDIKLFKSYIGGAESNQDIIRVNFGYQTNGAALAAATPFGAINLLEGLEESEYSKVVSLTGYYLGEAENIPVRWAEFHNDGYLYVWANLDDIESGAEDLTEDWFDSVFMTFNNVNKDFVYNGKVYPNALDEEYSKTKVVLGFQNELVIPTQRAFSVSSITQQPPTFVSVEPETGSFNLTLAEDNVFKFKFSKPVYIGEEGANIRLEGAGLGDGKELVLAQDPDDENGVIATLPASIKELNGDYQMIISCIAVEKGGQTAEPVELTYTYGDATGQAMVEFLNSDWWLKLGANTLPLGWQFGDVRIGDSYIDADGNAQNVTTYGSGVRLLDNGSSATYKQTIYFCNRDGAKSMIYGKQEGSKLHLAAGSYYITAPLGVHDGNGADGADPKITVYGLEDNTNVALAPSAMKIGGDRSSAVAFAENKFMFTVATEGDYVIEISCEVGTPKGVALAPVTVTNVYSAAYGYVKALNDQLAIMKELIDQNGAAYVASPLFKEFSANYEAASVWSAKQPKQYDAKVEELKGYISAFKDLLTSVSDFETALANANNVITNNADGPLADREEFATLKSIAAQYASYDAINTASVEANKEATNALNNAANNFIVLLKGMAFYQVQPQALSDLADSLGFDWSSLPEGAKISDKIAAQTGNNVDFINVLKTAVKWAIYKKFANNDIAWMPTKEVEDTLGNITDVPYLDVSTAFILNPLWRTTGRENKITGYNEMPGWTLSGFDLANVGDRYYGHAWYNAAATADDPFHDSQIGCGWFNGLWASQEISNLPAGQYLVGAGVACDDGAPWDVRIKTADSTLLQFTLKSNNNWTADPNSNCSFDTLALDVDKFTFELGQDGKGGWSQADHPQMILIGLNSAFNYIEAEAAMDAEFKQAIETVALQIVEAQDGLVTGLNGVLYNSVEEVPAGTFYILNGQVILK